MKIELKGIVTGVSGVMSRSSPDNSKFYYEQQILIMVPGFRDQFGEQIGKDETWEFKLYNDKIDRFNLHATIVGRKATVQGYLNSRTYKKNGEDAYQLSLILADIKLI